MGEQRVLEPTAGDGLRTFTHALLDDLEALQQLIDEGRIETGVRRIGAEQELFLVDAAYRPAPVAMQVLERLNAPQFTTELARYNLEINLPPLAFEGPCFGNLHRLVADHVDRVREAARAYDADVALVGILPTLRKSDLTLENMAPRRRYRMLNDAIVRSRGRSWDLHFKGIDDLHSRHDNVMFESACTSFQIHLQVDPDEFAALHNIMQAATAPVLAASVNSPLLLGRRLWSETRIPLFQQSIDTRWTSDHVRQGSPRVRFGERWLDDAILELFRDDVARFRVLLGATIDENPFEILARGGVPALRALCLHNGTVYRWNRGCYGVTDGVPHLRIEARAIPSGPTPVDETANAAFLLGLVLGMQRELGDVRERLRYSQARANFHSCAALGLNAQVDWVDGRALPVAELIVDELLPIARAGLRSRQVDEDDIERYLGVIRERVESRRTGARWQLHSYGRLRSSLREHRALATLTGDMVARQRTDMPVHTWAAARLEGAIPMRIRTLRVEDVMTTRVHTVGPDEPVALVSKIMEWKHVRHVPVEDGRENLVGLVTAVDVIKHLGRRGPREVECSVADVMATDLLTVTPETPVREALELLEAGFDCLPVVKGSALVGIVTERDFIHLITQMTSLGDSADRAASLASRSR